MCLLYRTLLFTVKIYSDGVSCTAYQGNPTLPCYGELWWEPCKLCCLATRALVLYSCSWDIAPAQLFLPSQSQWFWNPNYWWTPSYLCCRYCHEQNQPCEVILVLLRCHQRDKGEAVSSWLWLVFEICEETACPWPPWSNLQWSLHTCIYGWAHPKAARCIWAQSE